MFELATIQYKVVPLALEDAMHLYLSEDHVARMILSLRRDPAQGRRGPNGRLNTDWCQFRLVYEVVFGTEEIVVYLLRIKQARKKPSKIVEVLPYVKDLALDVVKAKVKQLIEGGDD